MPFKEKGYDPGVASRYTEPGVGRYTSLTCGGCPRLGGAANVGDAQGQGWARRSGWGWLCSACLVRLKLQRPLSPTQQRALDAAPLTEWFRVEHVRNAGVRCALSVCQQLEQLGHLEVRRESPPGVNRLEWLLGTPLEQSSEYRRLPIP